jgi:hypothetical protein
MSARTHTTTKATSNKKKERHSLPSSEPRRSSRIGTYSSDFVNSKPEPSSVDRHLTRKLTKGEIKLIHHTKIDMKALQDERTRIRIQQLYDADSDNDEGDKSEEKHVEVMHKDEGDDIIENAPSFAIPSTALRQNITKRRSQGRAKDRESIGSTSVPLHDLLTRRSLPRAKDTLYKQESSNSPVHQGINGRSTRSFVTPQMNKDIPMIVEYHHSIAKLTFGKTR